MVQESCLILSGIESNRRPQPPLSLYLNWNRDLLDFCRRFRSPCLSVLMVPINCAADISIYLTLFDTPILHKSVVLPDEKVDGARHD